MSSGIIYLCACRSLLILFKNLGTFVAKALLDSRVIDLPLSPVFLEMAVDGETYFEVQGANSEHSLFGNAKVDTGLHLIKVRHASHFDFSDTN